MQLIRGIVVAKYFWPRLILEHSQGTLSYVIETILIPMDFTCRRILMDVTLSVFMTIVSLSPRLCNRKKACSTTTLREVPKNKPGACLGLKYLTTAGPFDPNYYTSTITQAFLGRPKKLKGKNSCK